MAFVIALVSVFSVYTKPALAEETKLNPIDEDNLLTTTLHKSYKIIEGGYYAEVFLTVDVYRYPSGYPVVSFDGVSTSFVVYTYGATATWNANDLYIENGHLKWHYSLYFDNQYRSENVYQLII